MLEWVTKRYSAMPDKHLPNDTDKKLKAVVL